MIYKETFERLDFSRIRAILAEKCATSQGKKRAEKLSPYRTPDIALRSFAQTDQALVYPHALPFGSCAEGDELLRALEDSPYLSPRDFLRLSRVLDGIGTIKKRLAATSREEFGLLRELGDMLTGFGELFSLILATVDEDGVKETASPRLGEIRRAFASQRKEVLRKLESMISARKELFQESGVHYREGRLVLAVRRDKESELEGVVHGISSGGATVFIEPFETVVVNNKLRKLREEEREEIDRVLGALAEAVRDRISSIRDSLDTVGELDFIFARADWARQFKAATVDPDGTRLQLMSVRHPLLELKRDVVPLNLDLDDRSRVLLISGPNAGGKTVVIKTVGLAALLSSSGLHVPASPDTRIPFYGKVFVDIGDEQSLDDDLSSFTAHLANLKKIIEGADEKSLVLLDELGVSTSPEEGGALGMAVISALCEKKATVIVTTHLSSLKYFVEQHPEMINAGMEFTDHPTYRLIMGIPGASNAFEVASEVGFPGPVIDRARGFMNPELLESASLISSLSRERRKAEELTIELEGRLQETKELQERCLAQEAEFDKRRKRFDEELMGERKKILSQARAEIENLVRHIREEKASRESIRSAHERLQKVESQLQTQTPTTKGVRSDGLVPGARVRSRRLKKEGVVVEIDEGGGEALVELGSLRIGLGFDDLEVVAEESENIPQSEISADISFNPRLSVRGMRAEEAYERITGHVAEALALGIEEVAIVHGKGTGVLMAMVREFARTSKLVGSFRVGEPFEGGDGVTVLKLSRDA